MAELTHNDKVSLLIMGRGITSAHSLNGSRLGLGLVPSPRLLHSLYNDSRQLEAGVAGHLWSVVIREGVRERKMVSAHPPPGCFEIAPFLIIVRV